MAFSLCVIFICKIFEKFMCEILRTTHRKAKKEHRCEAAILIRERLNDIDIEESDKEILKKCERRIKSGEEYIETAAVDMGSIYSWKSHHDCANLANKYDVYDEC